MGKNSEISWTHHTFNPWRGCTKVSAGCANCYAEKLSKRNPSVLGVWGDDGVRAMASVDYWRLPLAWDAAARAAGERHRVFCASLADVFEDRPELVQPRATLMQVIELTPNLDWLLLTKRPQNIMRLIGQAVTLGAEDGDVAVGYAVRWLGRQRNAWLGTSVENQEAADERIGHLLATNAAITFLSCEPLLESVDLLNDNGLAGWDYLRGWKPASICGIRFPEGANTSRLDWVIVGGESGTAARPMHPDWARSLRDQCQAAGVAFHFKQWGEWAPFTNNTEPPPTAPVTSPVCLVKADGRIIRPYCHEDRPGHQMCRVGKTAAGRLLDGREWNELPAVAGVEVSK